LADGTPDAVKVSRLALAELTRRQLEMGLGIIAIDVPDRM
jgi:Arginyl-tRNA synthetase